MWRVFADFHTHSRYSHGKGTIAENAKAAQEQGLEVLGIADHGPANWGHMAVTKLSVFDRIIEESHKVAEEFSGLQILAGTEANLISYQGELDVPLEMQRKLDQVLAGFHTTVNPKNVDEGLKFLGDRFLAGFSGKLTQKVRNENTKAMVEAVFKNEIDIITHPGLHINIDTGELARACARKGTALEINAKHGVTSIGFIKAAAKEGVKFAIGSDAHSPDKVGRLKAGIHSAKQAGLSYEQIINIRDE